MGSFPSDITFKVNIDPASAIANFKKIEDHFKKGAQGIAGEYEKGSKVAMNMAKQMIDVSNRAGRQLETQIRSIEKQTQSLGKTATEMNEVQRKWMLERSRGLKNQEEQEKRINAIYDQRRKFFQEEERRQKTPPTGSLLLRGARDIFEGRMSYGVMDIGRAALGSMGGGAAGGAAGGAGGMLAGISGATLAIAGITGALVGMEAAGFAAAKAVGEYGREVHDMQIKTGMSVIEVQKLQFAAQLTGQDVSVLDRMMRGLTMAIEGTDKKAFTAAKTLQGMGVDLVALQQGGIKPLEMLQQISAALEAQPDKWLRNKDAIDLFGRSGIQALPMITEMNAALRESGRIEFFNQDQIDHMKQANVEITVMETKLKMIKLTLEWMVAKPFVVTLDIAGSLADWMGKGAGSAPQGPPNPQPEVPDDLMGRFKAAMDTQKTADRAPYVAGQQYAQQLQKNSLEAAEQELTAAKDLFEEDLKRAKLQTVTLSQLKEHEAAYKRIKDHVEALKQSETDRKTIMESLAHARELGSERVEHPFGVPAQQALDKILAQRGLRPGEAFAYLRPKFKAAFAGQITDEEGEQSAGFQRSMQEMLQTQSHERTSMLGQFVEPVGIRDLGHEGTTRADVEADINKRYQERLQIAEKQYNETVAEIGEREIKEGDLKEINKQNIELVKASGDWARKNDEARLESAKFRGELEKKAFDLAEKHAETMSRIQLADQEESIRHGADLARKNAELRFRGDNPAAGIAESYRIAVDESQQLYGLEMKRIDLHETGDKAIEDRAIALHKLHREDEAASEEAQYKLAQMQQQQLDTIKGKVEPLYQTLFTHPTQFGKQLRSTMTDAVLHPIVGGLSEMTAAALRPTIFGATGTGGIAGSFRSMFGGGRLNDVHLINGAVPVHIVGAGPSGAGGGGGGYSGGGGGFVGGGGGGLPTFNELVNLPMRGSGGTTDYGMMSVNDALGGPGSLANLPMRSGGYSSTGIAMAGLAAALGGGGGGTGGGGGRTPMNPLMAAIQKGMGKYFGGSYAGSGGLDRIGTNVGQYGSAITSTNVDATAAGRFQALSTGPFAGTPAGPAAGAAGMMLASAGIFGEQRGRWGGVAEATGGGFLVAGPIGAAIGAGISLGEMASGVEAPRYEVKRVVKTIYHIEINNTTADQIVNIANQSYGGKVSLAVKSPEVRHMLGLYAAGTGQGGMFPSSSSDPHGASLVESSGMLQQQATYQYGNAFAQSSNLPIYGGVQAQTLSAPGGGVNLSLNIGGTDAARFLQGNVVSPDVISQQYASAMNNSNGRVSQSLMMSEPGAIAG